MKIYLSGSIRGGRELANTYALIHDYLIDRGYTVLAEHVASPDVLEIETNMSEEDIYLQDVEWLNICDAMIAEVSVPSTGVGYEIAFVLEKKKPVLAVYEQTRKISAMIKGNTSATLLLCSYNGEEDLINILDDFLKSL